jgi:hypothetical protein
LSQIAAALGSRRCRFLIAAKQQHKFNWDGNDHEHTACVGWHEAVL